MNVFHPIRTTVLVATLLLTIHVHAQEVLTNQHLIQMAELGMGDAIIMSQIENANNDFDASTTALLALKKAGLSDAVLAKVIEADNNSDRKVVDGNDPMAPHRPGIYFMDSNGKMAELMPSVTGQSKSKGNFGRAMSYGIAKSKVVSRLTGNDARVQFAEVPSFYFYFDQKTGTLDQSGTVFYGFQQATSPNEFTLAQLDAHEEVRELETASMNNYTTEFGIDEKHTRPFDIEELAPGIFKVTPLDLVPGEYCFVYSGAAPYGYTQQKVFDFGIE